ncbi:CaiB/BaiF CoA transferase family protein [Jiangella alkaliphila]|uniref:Crotonobetainyl-CoA:carnitine CoA-transferase CaiB n=1 Tax=Jiangella alkaliphila TaxID=419479 RepID=A0A1H2JK32_9ACTN|nr:CaiB/BaiF CoA-transferase family protein [Jiangella alkaliphila]SDU56481.1 Crotonobetainyl-CoA:carnitine CoA-transferase CaiB [Jiangella alkaliphila]
MPSTDTAGPLSHVRVLDFTQLLQGPLATQILGDLGADVVKLEKPHGEWMRSWGILASTTAGEMDSFLAFNRNKRSVAADLKDPAVRDRLLDLSREFDVVVENFRPGVMDRLGLGYDDFAAVNPAIVYASSSGYGQTGPYRERPGQDLLVQALAGALHLTGRREDPPTPSGIGISDEYTGLHLAVAILAALSHRQATGIGQRVAVDLFSCTIAAQQQELTVWLNHRRPMPRAEENVGHVGATAPFGTYPTSDGHLALAMMPCPQLGKILGVDWLEEFDTNEKMFAGRDVIHRRLAAHFATGTTAAWLALLDAHDVWCAPVQDYRALERDPQVRHAGLLWDVPVGDDGATFRTVGSPFTFSRTPPALRRGVPRAGQHTDEILPALDEEV